MILPILCLVCVPIVLLLLRDTVVDDVALWCKRSRVRFQGRTQFRIFLIMHLRMTQNLVRCVLRGQKHISLNLPWQNYTQTIFRLWYHRQIVSVTVNIKLHKQIISCTSFKDIDFIYRHPKTLYPYHYLNLKISLQSWHFV